MRKYLFAAVAAAAIATPAVARDGSPYVGIEGGILLPEDQEYDLRTDIGTGRETFDNALVVNYSLGYDVDLIGGYDFGAFRLEAEVATKRANVDDALFSTDFLRQLSQEEGETIQNSDFEIEGKVNVLSFMANALIDFGDDDGLNGYIGGGFGRGRFKLFDASDGEWAMQAIAGVRLPVSLNLDAGLKYRYFHSGHLDFTDELEDSPADLSGRFRSHSLLLSLIYNFAAPVVIAPPPPPPPPPPAGERG